MRRFISLTYLIFMMLSGTQVSGITNVMYSNIKCINTSDTTAIKRKSFRDAISEMQNKDTLSYEDYRRKVSDDYNQYQNYVEKRYIAYRDSVMKDFVKALRRPWKQCESKPALPRPIDRSVGPEKIIPKIEKNNDELSNICPQHNIPDKEIKSEPKEIVILPQFDKKLRPQPFVPVVLKENIKAKDTFSFEVFGTEIGINTNGTCNFKLSGNTNTAVAETIEKILSDDKYTSILKQCIEIRDRYRLCDWAYYKTLQALGNTLLGEGTNEAKLFTGYMFCMSGYRIRFAFDSTGRMHLLAACKQGMVNRPYLSMAGESGENTYYLIEDELPDNHMYICNYSIPKEKAMSLDIIEEPLFDDDATDLNITLHSYSSLTFDYNINKNLIDFYNTYPTPYTRGDMYSKWTYYANAPISSNAMKSIYNKIKAAISGKNDVEAVNIIMDMIESYEYGYDDKVWGYDRVFFPDETLFYPMSDCEDHAILLTRLVRDILHLNTALVYYPGHLASAVCFKNNDVNGDYIMHGSDKYTICDPTIYYAGVGRTMHGMKNNDATLILIR